jgi:hypothetical protein
MDFSTRPRNMVSDLFFSSGRLPLFAHAYVKSNASTTQHTARLVDSLTAEQQQRLLGFLRASVAAGEPPCAISDDEGEEDGEVIFAAVEHI